MFQHCRGLAVVFYMKHNDVKVYTKGSGLHKPPRVMARVTELGFLFPCHMTGQSPSGTKFSGQI